MLFHTLISAIRHQMPATTAVVITVTSLLLFGSYETRLPLRDLKEASIEPQMVHIGLSLQRALLHFAWMFILCLIYTYRPSKICTK
jgi:hypothetical protein